VEAEPEVIDEDDEMDLDVSQVASPKNRRRDSDDETPRVCFMFVEIRLELDKF